MTLRINKKKKKKEREREREREIKLVQTYVRRGKGRISGLSPSDC